MRPFGCLVTILNTLDHLDKFDSKDVEGFLVGYSVNSKAFKVFNSRTRKVEENLHFNFLENKPNVAGSGPEWLFDIDLITKSMNYEPVTAGNQSNGNADVNAGDIPGDVNTGDIQATGIFDGAFDDRDWGVEADTNNLDSFTVVSPIPTTRVHKDHLKEQIIGDPNLNTQTKRMINFSKETAMVNFINKQRRTNHKDFQNYLFACFLSQMEPKTVIQALKDPSWIEAIQEELLQFKPQDVWTLVDLPYGKRTIGLKWVFRNKLDERDFIVYQMDVKSAFLYGKIEEELYVCQPPGFEDPDFPNKVYKVKNALYSLHQVPRANLPKVKDLNRLLIFSMEARSSMHSQYVPLSILHALSNFGRRLRSRRSMMKFGRVNIKESSIRRTLRLDDAEVPKPHHGMSLALWHLPLFVLLPIRNSISQEGWYWISREVTLLFDNMLVQAHEEVGIFQADAQSIPLPTEPSTSKPQKKHKPKRKHTKEPEVPPTKSQAEQNIPLPSPSHDPLPSDEDSLKLKELMDL
nr:hypothetical protein [Tanacetum cinerariifolium]